MTICGDCGQHLGDIGQLTHNCPGARHSEPYRPNIVIIPPLGGMEVEKFRKLSEHEDKTKCDQCGSTAVDHTEQQCKINQINKDIKKE